MNTPMIVEPYKQVYNSVDDMIAARCHGPNGQNGHGNHL